MIITRLRCKILQLHIRLEQKDVSLLDKLAQLSNRLNTLHLLQSLLDRTPEMDETLRSLKLRELDLASVLIDSTDVGVTSWLILVPNG
jgi:hypothetical protein